MFPRQSAKIGNQIDLGGQMKAESSKSKSYFFCISRKQFELHRGNLVLHQ